MASKSIEVDETLVDEIVDEIMTELSNKDTTQVAKPQTNLEEFKPQPTRQHEHRSVVDLSSRVEELERRLSKLTKGYSITSVEVERQLTEKTEEFLREQDKLMMNLQDQIDGLRTALIRIGNELRKTKEPISSQK